MGDIGKLGQAMGIEINCICSFFEFAQDGCAIRLCIGDACCAMAHCYPVVCGFDVMRFDLPDILPAP